MGKKVRIGLIGAGRIGRLHGANLAHSVADADLVAVADPMMNDEMKEWAASMGIEKCYSDPDEIINDKSIDAIFICSATNTHADLIKKGANAGKNIFCEKPIDTDLNKIKETLEIVKKAGVKLQVGFVRRFDHNHKKVHDTVAEGYLGKPHVIKVTSRDPDHQPMDYIKVSGGIFMDMTIHDFDMVRYLAGSEVTEVMAYGAELSGAGYAELGDVDTVIVMMKFENGALGVIDNSRAAHYGYDQRTEVHCDKGCVQVANDRNDMSMISTAEGVEISKPTWFFLERYNDAFISEAVEFTKAILNDTETLVNGNDGLAPVIIAMAAEKSLKEGRPVKVGEI
ncbi:myo-inositol 2-dehydrogenase/D-chiro-inositol 1-dehydrogenase [Aequitasia blattaphilus]|uniref:Inositol 2-dehydrogenase n=1 Tax=Aequitasia blattaphilus TaxID=2949332 RepID=A0ABT1EGJ7_9FIRM|nr:inositol 2-dehydrogenase [Aequitasia blattaphilus]MCP1103582.1 inositol 2-dehydrogenase [Aequitasia blattaphilus]MCR8616222.1 inositol 2-dehydrogenase [Aequitasia blattaphilus]